MSKVDPKVIRTRIAGDRTNLVKNKMVIFDCLLQCREDYMAAAEQAIANHKHWMADTSPERGLRQSMLQESAAIIDRCEKRLVMIRKAMEEMT